MLVKMAPCQWCSVCGTLREYGHMMLMRVGEYGETHGLCRRHARELARRILRVLEPKKRRAKK